VYRDTKALRIAQRFIPPPLGVTIKIKRMKKIQTAERVSQKDLSDNFVFQRSLLAYIEAAKLFREMF
jgi:hypothetical protein